MIRTNGASCRADSSFRVPRAGPAGRAAIIRVGMASTAAAPPSEASAEFTAQPAWCRCTVTPVPPGHASVGDAGTMGEGSVSRQGASAGASGQPPPVTRQHGNSYQIFMLVLTILSLAIMGALLLPLSQATRDALNVYDNLICFIFLADFAYNISGSRPRRQYFIHERGWLDLLGSIPSLGITPWGSLLRLFRISRLARIAHLLSGQRKKALIEDVVRNRGQYATFITVLLVLLVLSISSVLVLQFESTDPEANITTGGDALWWSVVTITTVGYGDHFPVTTLGRLTAVTVMFAGIGIIGALASILASLLVSPAASGSSAEQADDGAAGAEGGAGPEAGSAMEGGAVPGGHAPAAAQAGGLEAALADTRAELARTRAEMAELRLQIASIAGTGARRGASPPDA
jgi:voltage-gated potassium channel